LFRGEIEQVVGGIVGERVTAFDQQREPPQPSLRHGVRVAQGDGQLHGSIDSVQSLAERAEPMEHPPRHRPRGDAGVIGDQRHELIVVCCRVVQRDRPFDLLERFPESTSKEGDVALNRVAGDRQRLGVGLDRDRERASDQLTCRAEVGTDVVRCAEAEEPCAETGDIVGKDRCLAHLLPRGDRVGMGVAT
jgi:hypothetical protein